MNIETLLDIRIAPNEGVSSGQIHLAKGDHDYALFVNGEYQRTAYTANNKKHPIILQDEGLS